MLYPCTVEIVYFSIAPPPPFLFVGSNLWFRS